MTVQRQWTAFTLLVLLMPLTLGSYRPWVWSLAGVGIAALVLLWAYDAWRSDDAPTGWRLSLAPPLLMFLAVILWILVQITPIGPHHPIWALASDMLGQPLRGSISADPQATFVSLIRLLSFGGAFWIALQYGGDRDRAYQFLRWFALASGLYAFYGLVNYIAGNTMLLWYPRYAYMGDVTGTFVNRNSYATYAGLGLLTAMSLLIHRFRRAWQLADPTQLPPVRFVEALRGEPATYMTVAIVVAMALMQSHSRMGFIATLTGLIALLLLGRTLSSMRNRLIAMALTIGSGLVLLMWSGGRLLSRLEGTDTIDRMPVFLLAGKAIGASPWTGHGYGSFPGIFPMFRDVTLPADKVFTMAHDTYIELAFEIGLPATFLLLLAIAWLVVLCLIGAYKRRRDHLFATLAVAAAVLVGVHSLLDFSMQMPAVGCLFFALLGIGVAQARSSEPANRKMSRTPRDGD